MRRSSGQWSAVVSNDVAMAALVLAAIDQHLPRAGFAHLAEGDFHASLSVTRIIAGCALFLTFTQSFDRPGRYGRSRRFDTKPSNPIPQAARNRSGPISPCSNGATPSGGPIAAPNWSCAATAAGCAGRHHRA